MPLIEALTFIIVGAATATLAIIMGLVVIGIRLEERDLTMIRRKPPGLAAWLTRRILGLYVRKTNSVPGPDADPNEPTRRYERSG